MKYIKRRTKVDNKAFSFVEVTIVVVIMSVVIALAFNDSFKKEVDQTKLTTIKNDIAILEDMIDERISSKIDRGSYDFLEKDRVTLQVFSTKWNNRKAVADLQKINLEDYFKDFTTKLTGTFYYKDNYVYYYEEDLVLFDRDEETINNTLTEEEKLKATKVKKVSGDRATLILTEEGKVYSLGSNQSGQLARGKYGLEWEIRDSVGEDVLMGVKDEVAREIPYFAENKIKIKDVLSVSEKSFAISELGDLYMWGSNKFGTMGEDKGIIYDYTRADDPYIVDKTKRRIVIEPTLIKFPSNERVKRITSNGNTHLAITEDNKLYGWGLNKSKQLGLTEDIYKSPTEITYFKDNDIKLKEVRIGLGHTVFLDEKGSVYMLGDVSLCNGPFCGKPSVKVLLTPKKLDITNITQITSGENHILALDSSGNIFAWGDNNDGQMGTGNFNTGSTMWVEEPKQLFPTLEVEDRSAKIIKLETGENTSFILLDNGSIYSTGNNPFNQTGIYDPNSNLSIIKFTKINYFKDNGIEVYNMYPLSVAGAVIDKDKKLYTWGHNLNYQLGEGKVEGYNYDNCWPAAKKFIQFEEGIAKPYKK